MQNNNIGQSVTQTFAFSSPCSEIWNARILKLATIVCNLTTKSSMVRETAMPESVWPFSLQQNKFLIIENEIKWSMS